MRPMANGFVKEKQQQDGIIVRGIIRRRWGWAGLGYAKLSFDCYHLIAMIRLQPFDCYHFIAII